MSTRRYDLLPCPFCGDTPNQPERISSPNQRPVYGIHCASFCILMKRMTIKEVVQDWNTRDGKMMTGDPVENLRRLDEETGCDHEWHTAFPIDVENLPALPNGWYVWCLHCRQWAIQHSKFKDGFDVPAGDPIYIEKPNLREVKNGQK